MAMADMIAVAVGVGVFVLIALVLCLSWAVQGQRDRADSAMVGRRAKGLRSVGVRDRLGE